MADPKLPPPIKATKDTHGWKEGDLLYLYPSQTGKDRLRGIESAETDAAKQHDADVEMAEASAKYQKAAKQPNPAGGLDYWQNEVQSSAEKGMEIRRKRAKYGDYPNR